MLVSSDSRIGQNSTSRRGQAAGLWVMGFAFFATLMIAIAFLIQSPTQADDVAQQASPAKAALAAVSTESEAVQQVEQTESVVLPAFELQPAERVAQVELVKNEEQKAPAPSLKSQIAAHLAVGEFAPALKLAETAATPELKSELLNEVAAAQLKMGDQKAAMAAVRKIPVEGKREKAIEKTSKAARKTQHLAGGAQADFESLIQIIQSSVGEWEDTGEGGGTIQEFDSQAGGISVDPNGLLERVTTEDKAGQLKSLGFVARKAALNADMAEASGLRLVSLTRLEREVARLISEGKPVPESMKRLGGLHSVEYLFVYPEEGEVILAGQAEGWEYNSQNQAVGIKTGRPILHLDDLVTVLRTFSDEGAQKFRCLIAPRQAGLRKLKAFVDASTSPLKPGSTGRWVKKLENELGRQDTVFEGVPADSRVARVIIEADYRMKLIGVGKLPGAPGMASYFDLLGAKDARDASTLTALRWWLTLKCDAIKHSADHSVHQLVGSSVKCMSENELVNQQGERIHTWQSSASNSEFAQRFTDHYADLAKQQLVFADLQNVFDLSLVASILNQKKLDKLSNWDYGVFAADGEYETAKYNVPQELDSVGSYRVFSNREIAVQVAGGVSVNTNQFVHNREITKATPEMQAVADTNRSSLPENRWWWDAAAK